jgi:hypothetical protein
VAGIDKKVRPMGIRFIERQAVYTKATGPVRLAHGTEHGFGDVTGVLTVKPSGTQQHSTEGCKNVGRPK